MSGERKCEICGIDCDSMDELRVHQQTHHASKTASAKQEYPEISRLG